MKPGIAFLFAIMLLTVPSIGSAKDKAPPPDLSGSWSLNVEKSESLQEKMESVRSRMMGGGGGMGGPPGGMGGGPGGMGGGPGGMGGPPPGMGGGGHGGPPPEDMEGGGPGGPREFDPSKDPIMAELAHAPLFMKVQQSELKVIVGDGEQTLRTLWFLEGSENVRGLENLRAKWKDGRLEASGQSNGRELRETYKLSKDKESLTVTVKGEGPNGQSIELKRVYDRHRSGIE